MSSGSDNFMIPLADLSPVIPDSKRNKTYYGGTLTRGLAVGTSGAEFHVEWGTTVSLPNTQFNIYDLARSVYIKIMEW